MTQPTSINMTFDTSLVEVSPPKESLNTSFSTTESDPSDAGYPVPADSTTLQQTPTMQQGDFNQETPKASQVASILEAARTVTPIQHIPTKDAYNQWASVYDTDGNMLQAIDDLELETLLPELLTRTLSTRTQPATVDIVDLGCGTGRNTVKLAAYAWPDDRSVNITGLDFSQGMLDVAAKKIAALPRNANVSVRLEQADCFPTMAAPKAPPLPDVAGLEAVDAVTSTLVLEHIPLAPYFSSLAALVKKGGHALVTNMHSEMGVISQAGFINEQGVKVRGHSFAHTPLESAEEARRAGFEVIAVKERRMEQADVDSGRISHRGQKWVGIHVWYGLLLRKTV